MFHELLSPDHEDGRARLPRLSPPQAGHGGQPYRGIGPEAYLNGASQGPTPEDARPTARREERSYPYSK